MGLFADRLKDINNYTWFGSTADDNKYPILHNEDNGWIVGVPVDDYDAIIKHFDEVDEKVAELENKLKPSCGKAFKKMYDYINEWTPELKLPDSVKFDIKINEPWIELKTWLHTRIDGVHEEQEFRVNRYIGIPPLKTNIPKLGNTWYDAEYKDVCKYCNDMVDWKKREEGCDNYWIERNRIITKAHTEMLDSLEEWIKKGIEKLFNNLLSNSS